MVDEIRLDGRVAIVTGAGNGLGRAHALALAARGAAVVVNDVGGAVDGRGASTAADAVVEEITAAGGRAVASRESVARRAGGQAMVEQALDELGGLDIVVANAGIQRDAPYEEYDEQDMHEMLDVHLKGSFWVTQAAYRVMKENRYGRVIFTTSGSGLFGRGNSPGYTAAKGGIYGLMITLAIEGAPHGVLANAIAPIASTRMTASHFADDFLDRMPPEHVSDLVVYLASDHCTISHQVIEAGFDLYARVFVGRTAGWRRDAATFAGPEAIAEHLDEIRDLSRYVVPDTAYDDIDDIVGRRRP
jgi:NAD(P)-dependent dehydrogenase (short-subunit alcohol dehydrogenase family)